MQFDKHTASATTSTPLGATLSALGFSASPGLYDRLFSCRDAVPLLHAIASAFDQSCVLTADEAESYAQLTDPSANVGENEAEDQSGLDDSDRQNQPITPGVHHQPYPPAPLLAHEEAIALASSAQLDFNVDFHAVVGYHRDATEHTHPNGAGDSESELVCALRQRLECVRQQTEALRQILGDDDSESEEEFERDEYDDVDNPEERRADDDESEEDYDDDNNDDVEEDYDPIDDVMALRDDLTSLLYALRPRSPRGDSVGTYVEAERRVLEQVVREAAAAAAAVLGGASGNIEQLDAPFERAAAEEDEYQSQAAMIDSYAKLCAQTIRLRATQLRASGAKSGTSSPGYAALAAQFDDRCAAVMTVVEQRARATLSDAVASARADGISRRHDKCADALTALVTRLVEQRVRVMCVRAAQTRAARARTQLFDALRIISDSVADVKPELAVAGDDEHTVRLQQQQRRHPTSNGYESAKRTVPDPSLLYSNDTAGTLTANYIKTHGEATSIFNSTFERSADTLQSFRSRTGARRAWIDVDLDPGTQSLIARLEEHVASNALVLETLLRAQSRLEQETSV